MPGPDPQAGTFGETFGRAPRRGLAGRSCYSFTAILCLVLVSKPQRPTDPHKKTFTRSAGALFSPGAALDNMVHVPWLCVGGAGGAAWGCGGLARGVLRAVSAPPGGFSARAGAWGRPTVCKSCVRKSRGNKYGNGRERGTKEVRKRNCG